MSSSGVEKRVRWMKKQANQSSFSYPQFTFSFDRSSSSSIAFYGNQCHLCPRQSVFYAFTLFDCIFIQLSRTVCLFGLNTALCPALEKTKLDKISVEENEKGREEKKMRNNCENIVLNLMKGIIASPSFLPISYLRMSLTFTFIFYVLTLSQTFTIQFPWLTFTRGQNQIKYVESCEKTFTLLWCHIN